MSVQVDLPDTGTMIFTPDAVYMGESYGPPATPAAIVIQEQTGATMVFGHDAEQVHQLRLAPEGSYT
jgi:N-acyl homoserine lactone hydrolase